MEYIKCKARVTKKVYSNGDFYIWSIRPNEFPSPIELNQYGNASIVGELSYLSEGKDYDFVLNDKGTTKYGHQYEVIDVPSISIQNIEDLTEEEKFEILMECTSSKRIANNILAGCPDFIALAVTKGADAIDESKIVGVGKVYKNAYCRVLVEKYKYYAFTHLDEIKPYKLTISEAKALFGYYSDIEKSKNALKEDPYFVLIEVLGRTFAKADYLILELRPELVDSDIRGEAIVLDVLKECEAEGSSRLDGYSLYYIVKEDYKNVSTIAPNLKNISQNSPRIFYDEKSGDLSRMDTYIAEANVADFVINKVKNSIKLDIDWSKYTHNEDGFDMTEQQSKALENFCNSNISLLTGYAGCVDKDTEFFNGHEWKKISEYKDGDMVLQYNADGSANMVNPISYIKLPCTHMYHFHTKYGIDQTLSDDHIMVFDERYTKGHQNRQYFHRLIQMPVTEFVESQRNGSFQATKHKIRTTFKYSGKGIDLTDSEIKVMCAVICDGSFYSNSNPNRDSWTTCRFHIKKNRKKLALISLFEEANIEYKIVPSANKDYTDFYIKAPRREKVFSDYWYNCNNHQLNVICENILQWDGSVYNNRMSFATNVKENADFVQFAFSSIGYRAVVLENNRIGQTHMANGKEYKYKTIDYRISITKRNLVGFASKSNTHNTELTYIYDVVPQDGYKYCFNVPSEMLVLRRNGKIFITHNCGKTTSIQGLIQLMEDNDMSYTLLTPTGKASKVLSEATHRSAQTIHRACFSGEIATDVVVVDEASMINLEVMNMLINSITNPNARIVFSLDNAQLTPIGVGKVISDLIETNIVPKTELTQVFRYTDDGSLFVATNIRNGKNFFTSDNVKEKGNTFSVSSNYKFIETSNDDLFDEVIRQYKGLISQGVKQDDILVMCPYNVSKIGNYAICNAIQEEFNPPKPNELTHKRRIGGTTIVFRKGDIVVNKKNNYSIPTEEGYNVLMSDSMLTEEDVATSIVLNGQMGKIVQVVKEGLLIKFDEEILFFNKQNINNLLLGYSISTHSSQGSSAQYTISIVSDLCKRMLSKELIYVADTRCKKSHIDIGQQDAFLYALSHSDNQHRYTWLKEMLIQGYKN